MRNKCAYSCSTKIHALGFSELLEGILCLLMAVEAFSLDEVIEMLKEVVVGWQEVRWIQWMRQNFVAQFIQLLKHWLCDVQSGAVVKNWAPSVDHCQLQCYSYSFQCISSICWAYFSDVMISPGFRKLEWIRSAANHQTVTVTFFWCKSGLGKCFGASSWSSH